MWLNEKCIGCKVQNMRTNEWTMKKIPITREFVMKLLMQQMVSLWKRFAKEKIHFRWFFYTQTKKNSRENARAHWNVDREYVKQHVCNCDPNNFRGFWFNCEKFHVVRLLMPNNRFHIKQISAGFWPLMIFNHLFLWFSLSFKKILNLIKANICKCYRI